MAPFLSTTNGCVLLAAVLLPVAPVGHVGPVVSGRRLATDYAGGEVRRIEVDTRIELESTTTISGDAGGRGAIPPMSSSLELREVAVDRVVEHANGRPIKVERTFEEVGGKATMTFGEREMEGELESPLSGLTLEIVRDAEGEIEVSVKKGRAPSGEDALAGHRPELFLDALLPAGEIEEDATWDLDADAVHRALRLDVHAGLFRPPAPEEDAEGARGRRGGALAGELRLLREIEWKGKAVLAAIEEEGGKASARIELELDGSGEVAEPERGERAGGRMFEPALAPVLAGTVTIHLEGELIYALGEKRPQTLELEGPMQTEWVRERERNGQTIRSETKSEGTLKIEVKIAKEE